MEKKSKQQTLQNAWPFPLKLSIKIRNSSFQDIWNLISTSFSMYSPFLSPPLTHWGGWGWGWAILIHIAACGVAVWLCGWKLYSSTVQEGVKIWERYCRIVTLEENRRRAMKNATLPGKSGASMVPHLFVFWLCCVWGEVVQIFLSWQFPISTAITSNCKLYLILYFPSAEVSGTFLC